MGNNTTKLPLQPPSPPDDGDDFSYVFHFAPSTVRVMITVTIAINNTFYVR